MSDQESFISHLVELRQRLVRAVGAVLAIFVVLFIYPGAGFIYDLLALPLMNALPEGAKMIATGVITPFMVPVKVTALVGFMISLPFVLYQAWAFVAPGLYEHEKKLALPLIVASTVLFFLGVAFCYFFVFGKVFAFIHDFAPKSITPAPDIEAYFSFVITMLRACGKLGELLTRLNALAPAQEAAPWSFDPTVDPHAFELLGFAEASAGIARTQRENREGWWAHATRSKAFILDA